MNRDFNKPLNKKIIIIIIFRLHAFRGIGLAFINCAKFHRAALDLAEMSRIPVINCTCDKVSGLVTLFW